MKLYVNGDQELASFELAVDPATGMCNPRVDALGYRVEGPAAKASLVKDEDTGGLRCVLELPGITRAAVVIEKDDVKSLKALMSKDAVKFMVKALM